MERWLTENPRAIIVDNDTAIVALYTRVFGTGKVGPNLTWYLDGDSTLTISGTGGMYTSYTQSTIPWAAKRDVIKRVVIENGVSTIGNNAFINCTNLESIVIGTGVTTIYNYAFSNCPNLKYIVSKRTSAPKINNTTVFNGTDAGFMIYVPCGAISTYKTATRWSKFASYVASVADLYKVNVVSSDEALGSVTVYDEVCTKNVLTVDVEAKVLDDTKARFTHWSDSEDSTMVTRTLVVDGDINLKAIFAEIIAKGQCGPDLYWVLDKEGNLVITGTGDMYNYASSTVVPWVAYAKQIVRVQMDEGATSVGAYAFYTCSNLATVKMPSSLRTIHSYAFYACVSLDDVTLPTALDTIGSNVFSACSSLSDITIPSSVNYMGSSNFYNCNSLRSAVINASISSVPAYTFYRCVELDSVDLGSVNRVGAYAFYNCKSLEQVIATGTLGVEGNYAFYGCSLLTSINPVYFSNWANYAFAECSKLTSVEVSGSQLPTTAFYDCYALKSAKISGTMTTVGAYAFAGCQSLTEVNLLPTMTSIQNNAFQNCYLLPALSIPNSITAIGATAFAGCRSLTRMSLPDGMSTVSSSLFSGCTALQQVKIPANCVTIEDGAFRDCKSLTQFSVPASVTALGANLFYGDSSLVTLMIRRAEAPLTTLGADALKNTPSSLGIYTICSVVDDYKSATRWSVYAVQIKSEADLYKVSLSVNDNTLGRVEIIKSDCEDNQVVDSIVASSVGDGSFLKWSDGVKDSVRSLVLTGDTTLVATFVKVISSGKCGDNLTWMIDNRGVLTISGTGEMYDYKEGTAPWYADRNSITSIVVEDSVATVGSNAFQGLTNVSDITLGKGITAIGKNAFADCSALNSVLLNSTAAKVASLKSGAFDNAKSGFEIYVPCGLVDTYQDASSWSDYASQIRSSIFLYKVKVESNNDTWGTVSIVDTLCSDNVSQIRVHAFATDSSRLSNWKDDWNNIDTLRTVDVTGDMTLTAVFAEILAKGQCGDDLYWLLDKEGNLVITGTGAMYNYKTATEVGWTDYTEQIKRVEMNEGATTVGTYAFYSCPNLVSVNLPSTLNEIGDYAFYACSGIENFIFPEKVTKLGSNIFRGCTALTQIDIPASVTSMGSYNFYNCTSLNKAVVNASVKTLPEATFCGCVLLKSAHLKNINTIGGYAFSGCKILSDMTSAGDILYLSGNNCFYNCCELDTIKTVNFQSAGSAAFYNCRKLKSVKIDGNTIAASAFQGCTSLDTVSYLGSMQYIGSNAFNGCVSLPSVPLPNSIRTIEEGAFSGCVLFTNVALPHGISYVAKNLLYGCSNLTSCTIPNSVTSIGDGAFCGCPLLHKVIIPSPVTTIGANAFLNDKMLDTLMVRRYEEPLTYLGTNALSNVDSNLVVFVPCSRLEDYQTEATWTKFADRMQKESSLYTVKLYPNYKSRGFAKIIGTACVDSISVDTIMAFGKGCGRFQSWSDGVTDNPRVIRKTSNIILLAIFNADTLVNGQTGDLKWTIYCDSLLSLTGTPVIADYNSPKETPWYKYRDKINMVELGDTVEVLGNHALDGLDVVETISLPKSVRRIGAYAMANMTELDTLLLSDGITTIDSMAFANSAIRYVYIPNTVTSMASGSFSNCANLQSVIIPNKLDTLKHDMFAGCTALTSVLLPTKMSVIEENAFKNCSSLNNVTIPDGCDSIAADAFVGCTSLDTIICVRDSGELVKLGGLSFGTPTADMKIFVDCNLIDEYINAADWQPYKNNLTTFGQIYNLTLKVNNAEWGSTDLFYSRCSTEGTQDSIKATPAAHFHFVGWSDGDTSMTRSILLKSDSTLTANFAPDTFVISALADGEGSVKGDGKYIYNEVATLTATAKDGFHFVRWNDNTTKAEYKLIVTQDSALTAYFAIDTFKLKALAVNGTATGSGDFLYGDTATVSAVADDGAHFKGWSNGDSTLSIKVIITSDSTVTAYFELDSFKVNVLAKNGSVSGAGVYKYGETAKLVATPNEGYHFLSWSNGETADSLKFKVYGDTTVTANFVIDTFQVSLTAVGSGKVSGDGAYTYGSVAEIAAQPEKGHHLLSWSNGVTALTQQIKMTADTALTATFVVDTFTVSGKAQHGTITGLGSYIYGAAVDLIAVPDKGYHFKGWSTGVADDSISFVALADTAFVADFVVDSFKISLNESDYGTVKGAKSGTYAYGDTLNLVAVPDSGYHFVRWSNDETESSLKLVVAGDSSLKAFFAKDTIYFSIDAVAENGKVLGAGDYMAGTYATLVAVADSGYKFSKWSNGSTRDTVKFEVTGDSTFTAYFTRVYMVSAIAENGTVKGAGEYEENKTATLVAVSDEGYHFCKWSNGATTDTVRFQVKSDTSLTAYFAKDTIYYTISAVAENGKVKGTGKYIADSTATLIAVADSGYKFSKWSNGSSLDTLKFVVKHDSSLTAIFIKDTTKSDTVTPVKPDTIYYTISAVAENGKVLGAGKYIADSSAILIAVADSGYKFSKWSNGSTRDTLNFVVKQDSTLTAYFTRFYTVSATAENGSVNGAGKYEENKVATLIATSDKGYHFSKWSNGAKSDTLRIKVSSDTSLIAYFAKDTVYYTISAVAENGKVKGTGKYIADSTATLIAVADSGYKFSKWSNGSTRDTLKFVVKHDSTLTATFIKDTTKSDTVTPVKPDTIYYTISAVAKNGKVKGTGKYIADSTATLIAVADSGYKFSKWSNGSSLDTLKFVVKHDSTLTATFIKDTTKSDTVTPVKPDTIYYTISAAAKNGKVLGTGKYIADSTATLIAVADSGYKFSKWSNGSTRDTLKFIVKHDSTLTATFVKEADVKPDTTHKDSVYYEVLAYANYGKVKGAGKYLSGSKVTLVAVADSGYRFTGWSNNEVSDTLRFVIKSDTTFAAHFSIDTTEKDTDEYFEVIAVADYGLVKGAGLYLAGDTAKLVAVPDAGYEFVGWSNGDNSSVIYVKVISDTTIVAKFISSTKYSVKEKNADAKMGSVIGVGEYPAGTEVILIAQPASANIHFVRWDNGDTSAVRTVTVDSNIVVRAVFEYNEVDETETLVNVYTMDGKLVRMNFGREHALDALPRGVYILRKINKNESEIVRKWSDFYE